MSHDFQTHKLRQLLPSLWIRLIIFYTPFHPSASYHNYWKENRNGSRPSHPDCSLLANTAMVPQANKTFDWEATPPAKRHEQCPSTIHSRTALSPWQPASSHGLPRSRKSLQGRAMSQATKDTILNSWRTTTKNNTVSILRSGSHLRIGEMWIPLTHLLKMCWSFCENSVKGV